MACTELIGAARQSKPLQQRRELVILWLSGCCALWLATLASAVVVALGGRPLQEPARRALDLRLIPRANAPPRLGHVFALAAHNLPIAAWPLLLGIVGFQHHGVSRRIGDVLVLACLLVNACVVGAALGAYGARLIRYIPNLPPEWAGLALGYASWAVQRRRDMRSGERMKWLVLIVMALIAAAVLETDFVPHA